MSRAEAAALVTGASSGLGRVLARRLGERRRRVLLLARDRERLDAAAGEVESAGGRAEVLTADVRERAQVEQAVAGHEIDVLLHAAGVLELGPVGSVGSVGEAEVRRLLEVNVLGTINVVTACLDSLARHRGRVGLLSSIVGALAVPGGFSAYAATKWGVRGWAETARPELAARGISLTVAYPATIDTPMVAELDDSAPPVYRAFGWHAAEDVADRLLRDLHRRRDASWSSPTDRLAAFAYRLVPRTFSAAFRLVTRLRDPGANGAAARGPESRP